MHSWNLASSYFYLERKELCCIISYNILLREIRGGPVCVVEGEVDVVTRGRRRTVDIRVFSRRIANTWEDFIRIGTKTLSVRHGEGIKEEREGEDGQAFLHLQSLQILEMIRRRNWRVLITLRLSVEWTGPGPPPPLPDGKNAHMLEVDKI